MYTPSSKTPLASLFESTASNYVRNSLNFSTQRWDVWKTLNQRSSSSQIRGTFCPIHVWCHLPSWRTLTTLLMQASRKGYGYLQRSMRTGPPWYQYAKPSCLAHRRQRFVFAGITPLPWTPQLKKHRHPILMPEDLMQKLSGGYYFSKIDLAEAYNQIKLAPKSPKGWLWAPIVASYYRPASHTRYPQQ